MPDEQPISDSPTAGANAQDTNYVVVARRYRPQLFEELIGQQHVVQALTAAIESNRVGHAYLFSGARGVGKTSAARILAKALNCEQGPTRNPCGTCESCLSIAQGSDVDVLELDGASNNGVEEIRKLRQNAGVRPSRSRMKIYIIDEVHMLSRSAFNALLKTLEEPPEHVRFIFATTEPEKIPITVLSRCQRFDFAGIETTKIEQRLAQIATSEGSEVEPEALQVLARRAAGSMRDSQSLLEQLLSVSSGKVTVDDVTRLLGTAPAARVGNLAAMLIAHDAAGALREIDESVAQGVEPSALIDQLLEYFRDVMVIAVGSQKDQLRYTGSSQVEEVTRLAGQLGLETLLAISQILERTATQMRSSLHGRTLLEMAIVRIAHLENLDELSSLVAAFQKGTVPSARSGQPSAGRRPAAGEVKKNAPATVTRDSQRADTPPVISPPAAAPAETAAGENSTSRRPSDSDTPPEEQPSRTSSANIRPLGQWNETTAPDLWKRMLDDLQGLVAAQAKLFERVRFVQPDKLIVTFDTEHRMGKEFCERPEQKRKLEQALTGVGAESVHLDFEIRELKSDQAQEIVPRSVSRRQKIEEIRQRDIVQRAAELFGEEKMRIDPPSS